MTLRRCGRGATMFMMMMASAACGGFASPEPVAKPERVDRAARPVRGGRRGGCLGFSSERYGAFQACTSATQLTLSGIHPGAYTVSRFDRSAPLSVQVPAGEAVPLPPRQPLEELPD